MRTPNCLPLQALLAALLPLGVAALQSATAVPASVCRNGWGSKFGSRLLTRNPAAASEPQPEMRESSEIRGMYASFVDTALRGFRGSSFLLHDGSRAAFESEAEHWVEKAFGDANPSTASAWLHSAGRDNKTARVGSATLVGTNSSSSPLGERQPGVVALGAAALRSCLSLLHSLLMARWDARPGSFVRVPAPSAWGGMVLLSGGDRNTALGDRVVANRNHASFARLHGYAHWWHKGSMVKELGSAPRDENERMRIGAAGAGAG